MIREWLVPHHSRYPRSVIGKLKSNQNLKIELKHRDIIIGEIFSTIASRTTKELKGLLIPSKEYQKIRSHINKYNEIYHNPKSKGIIDRFLDKQLGKKYTELNSWFKDFQITLDDEPITDNNSEIRVVDNLTKTGLGNIELSIEVWNLNSDSVSQQFKTYSIEYVYPAAPKHVIEIKYKNEIILKY